MTFAVCIHGRGYHHEARENEPCSDCEELDALKQLERLRRAVCDQSSAEGVVLRQIDLIRDRRAHDTEVFTAEQIKTALSQ